MKLWTKISWESFYLRTLYINGVHRGEVGRPIASVLPLKSYKKYTAELGV